MQPKYVFIDWYHFVLNLLIVTIYLNNYLMFIFGSTTSVAWHRACHAVNHVAHRPATRCVCLSIASLCSGVTSLLVAGVYHSAETETF